MPRRWSSFPRLITERLLACGFHIVKSSCERHAAMTASDKWRVLIADDEPAARRGVRQLLAPYARYSVVGECRDGREVLDALDTLTPDLLFLDVQMPELGGFEVIRRRTVERMP